jgi:hypothetical protein
MLNLIRFRVCSSFMERIDRKITPMQNSALYPIAQIPAKVTFQGREDGE